MAVQFKDYYKILGVSRDASRTEIQRAYRKLARKCHPDLNKEAGAEDRFKEINEAYEVLKDPEKRKKYDQVGSGWQPGDHFRPPPGAGGPSGFASGNPGQAETFFWESSGGDYSDFFEALFGGRMRQPQSAGGGQTFSINRRGSDHEAVLRIPLEEAVRGGVKSITLQTMATVADGTPSAREKRYDVKIPPGVLPGQKIRLAGQGGQGMGDGGRGDLLLKVEIDPHPRFRLEGRDLYTDIAITPWEAALGAEIEIDTPTEPVTLKIPAGIQSGQKLRLRARGMPGTRGTAGDLYCVIQIKVPKKMSEKERALFEEMKKVSTFNPR